MLARHGVAPMGDDDDKPVKKRGERGGKNRPSKKAWQARHLGFVAPPRPLIPALVLPPPKAATAGTSAKSGAPVVVAAAPVVVAAAVVLPKAAPVVVAAALVLPKATPSLLAAALVSPEAITGVVYLKATTIFFVVCVPFPRVTPKLGLMF